LTQIARIAQFFFAGEIKTLIYPAPQFAWGREFTQFLILRTPVTFAVSIIRFLNIAYNQGQVLIHDRWF